MIRHRAEPETIDPAVAAELDALEAALAGEPGAEPDLRALVRDVRADAPSMPLALRTRLDAGVAAGFPKAARPKRRLARRALPFLAGAAATLVVVGGVGFAVLHEQREDISSFSQNSAVLPSAAEDGDKTLSPATQESLTGSSASDDSAAAPAKRKVERAVDLALTVQPGALQDAADGVVRVTQGAGGYVAASQVSARGRGGDATFTLRVPTARLDTAIARLAKLGHVASLDQGSRDITSTYTSAADRLGDARGERRALLRALAKAETAGEIAALRERIAQNRSTIATLQARLAKVRGRADLATVRATIHAPRHAAAGATDDGGWSPGDAAGDALRVLEVVAGVLIVAAAILVPVGLLAGLAAWAARGLRRRRRERALDA